MKRKKLLSTAVAGMLVAAQMVMPVMAADTGEVDVDVSTKTVVIRVQVPTTLEIAVNQFEKDDAGSQIFSGDFTIQNKSEIPVKMTVTSTVELASTNPIGLVGTKAEAEASSATDGEAWLAVAAMVAANKYEATADATDKKIGSLSETSANVATVALVTDTNDPDVNKGKVEQTFYLAANATPTVTYTKVAPTDADELATAKKISYAQIYELTALTTQPTTDATLQTAVDAEDVIAIDGSDAISVLKKGTAGVTYAAGSTYYSIAANTTAAKDLVQGKVYMYGEAAPATTGGDAGFRFIGKLSDKETWTDTDIVNVKIAYDIKGVTGTKYTEVQPSCTYGLYEAVTPEAPSITTTTYSYDRTADLPITVDLGEGNLAATDVQSIEWSATRDGSYTTFAKGTKWTYANGVISFKSGTWGSGAVNDKKYLKVTFDDTAATSVILELTITK